MNRIQKITKWTCLILLGILTFTLTIGQLIPIGFKDNDISRNFIDVAWITIPVLILLTLLWTVTKQKSKFYNLLVFIVTPIVALSSYIGIGLFLYAYGFGSWIDANIIYENKSNHQIVIKEQWYDVGAFGYGGKRIVKTVPFLFLWEYNTKIDSSKIDKNNWTLVNKEGDIKFP